MTAEWRRFRKLCLWCLVFCVSSPWDASALVTDGTYSISGANIPNTEYGVAEAFEITGFAVLVLSNDLPSEATFDVVANGAPLGLRVVVPPRATGVFTTQGLVRVGAGGTFGFQSVVANPGAGSSPPSAVVRFTAHTRQLPSAPVSTSSAVGLGLLALLLAAFSVQRLRAVG